MDLGVAVELFTTGDTTLRSTKNHYLYSTGQYQHIHRPAYDGLPILIAHILYAHNYIKNDGNFDIIHGHNPYIGPALMASTGGSLPPFLHTVHGPPFTTADRLPQGIPDNLPMWEQLAKAEHMYFVGISTSAMSTAPYSLRRKALPIVYNGVNVDDFPFVDNKEDYFITLARFHPDKGQYRAIKACLSEGFNLKMAGLVGNMTKPKQVLMELANPASKYRSLTDFRYFSDSIFPLLDDQIEYVGDLKGSNKMKFLSQAKALLFPIQWEEPFGMATIEALACGTPVIAMARGSMPEIIKHGYNGFLVHNQTELRYYLKRTHEINPADCRQSVKRKFTAKTMAEKYLERYNTILSLEKSLTSGTRRKRRGLRSPIL